jgi:hypothetical protein
LERVACGRFGLAPSEFWRSTLRTVANIIAGASEAEDFRNREAWERERWGAATYLQPHMKKGAKFKLTDLIVFPWEEEPKQETQDEETTRLEREERWKKWDEKFANKWQLPSPE